jgi:hypothetical protein
MEFNLVAAIIAFAIVGSIYLMVYLRGQKNNKPFEFTTHNTIIAIVALAGAYYLIAGIFGLLK